jgi:molybdopterin synthase sulfur carrier subunit
MIKVEFLGPIGKESIELNVGSLKELSNELKKDEEIASWLDDCAVALNDVMVNDLEIKLNDGDKVSLLPPVCGG